MTNTPNLDLPMLMASQAQKHLTHNEALLRLDALVHLAVLGRGRTAPPQEPVEGDRFIVASGAVGSWSGHDLTIAAWQDGVWQFLSPCTGWLAWVADEGALLVWNGANWSAADRPLNPAPMIGVNATADATNRLSVSAAATLLNHAGQGHQLKLNRKSAADTASLLFQTDFAGRAEIGTGGDDHLTVKVSANGADWRTALAVNPVNGNLGLGGLRNAWARLQMAEAASGALEALAVQNTGAGANALVIARFMNDTSQAGFFLNSSARTVDGGAGGFSFYNDAGAVNFRAAGGVTLHAGSGAVTPRTDNANSLGSASARWSSVWTVNGTIQTSDGREKERRGSLESVAVALVEAVDPILFRWIEGGVDMHPIPPMGGEEASAPPHEPRAASRPGRRLHAGIVAQDLKRAMDDVGVDFGAWGLENRDDPASRQWVRPDQLVFVLWSALRQTRAELRELGERLGRNGASRA